MKVELLPNLRPCKICPRIFNSGAAAGAALEGPSNTFEDLINTLSGYDNRGKCGYPKSCGANFPEKATCFIRRERATPLSFSNLRPA